MNNHFFSDVYIEFHPNFDISGYGPLEVKKWQDEKGNTWHGQVKPGTKIKHGRCVKISKDEFIYDGFYKDDQKHGPHLELLFSGHYRVHQFEMGKDKGWI